MAILKTPKGYINEGEIKRKYRLNEFNPHQLPVYCVSRELVEDLNYTDLGDRVPLFCDLKIVLPEFLILLPESCLPSPTCDGAFIDSIFVTHEEQQDEVFSSIIRYMGGDSSGKVFSCLKRVRRDGTFKQSVFSGDNPKQQQDALRLRDFVVQIILLLHYYPSYSTPYDQKPTPIKGFSVKKEVVGEKNVYPRWLRTPDNEEKTPQQPRVGSHGVTKATHWRRGHWRLQACGEGLAERKPTWVRASLINPC